MPVVQQLLLAALAPDVDEPDEPPHAPGEAEAAQGPGVAQGVGGRSVRVVDLARNDAAYVGQGEQDAWDVVKLSLCSMVVLYTA